MHHLDTCLMVHAEEDEDAMTEPLVVMTATELESLIRRVVREESGQGTLSGDVLDTAQAAALVGVHPATLRRWAKAGRVPHGWAGSEMRFRRQDVEELIHGSRPA